MPCSQNLLKRSGVQNKRSAPREHDQTPSPSLASSARPPAGDQPREAGSLQPDENDDRTITFIDYTPFYFMLIAKTGIPPVTRGKFVQMRHATALYLIFSPAEFTKYHANIVARFCMDKGVEGAYDQNGTKFILADQAWDILGGGKFERDEKNKVIKLFDDSMAYGKFDAMTLREMTAALPDLAGYTIDIE